MFVADRYALNSVEAIDIIILIDLPCCTLNRPPLQYTWTTSLAIHLNDLLPCCALDCHPLPYT